MKFKNIMIPVCAVISLIILFVILHLALIGSVPVTNIRMDGWNTRTVSQEEINLGLKDFSYYGNYLKSESGDPWVFLDGINESHNMQYLYIDIEDLSEASAPMQVFLSTDDGLINTGYYNLYQGVNIICLERNDFNQIRLDLTNKYGTYFWINKISFTDNYFLALPVWFWAIYLLVAAIMATLLILLAKGKLSQIEGNERKSEYWSEWKGFICESFRVHKTAFIVGGIIVILIFGYEITNFTLGVDEEREIVHSYGTTENIDTSRLAGGEGRYSIVLIKHLLSPDGVFTPYMDTLIAVIGIALAAIVNIINFERCSGKRFKTLTCIIFMGLFCSLPYVVTDWMCYSIMNSSLSIGILLVSLSIYTICVRIFPVSINLNIEYKNPSSLQKSWSWLLCSSFLCAFTIAIVESLAPYFILSAAFCVLFYIIYDYEAGFKQFFLKTVSFIAAFLIGFGVYSVIKAILGTNGYTDKLVHWGKESISDILMNWLGYLNFTFNAARPGSDLSAISVLCFALILLLIGVRQKKLERFFLILFNGLCCFICAFALNIVIGGFSPIRTMIPLMLLTSAPWIIAIESLASYKVVRVVPIMASAVILFYQGVWVNKIFTGANLAYQLDMEWGYDIGTEVMNVCPNGYSVKPLVFAGRYWHSSPEIIKIDAAGWSISALASKNMVYFLRTLGFEFIHSDRMQQAQGETYAEDMPVYPQEGYIREFDDMIVVRLS